MLTEFSFALFVASVCHDIDHPGVSNQYLINMQSELALTYNDRSVLENHHAYQTFLILQNPEFNITANLEPAEVLLNILTFSHLQVKTFRRILISAILATDMSTHFELVSKFTTHIETTPFNSEDSKVTFLFSYASSSFSIVNFLSMSCFIQQISAMQ